MTPVAAFLGSARRRLAFVAAIEGAAIGLGTAAFLILLGWPGRAAILTPVAAGILAATIGAFARARLVRREAVAVALAVERRAPQSRNLIISAVEVVSGHTAASAYVGGVVMERANALVRTLDAAALFPFGRRTLMLSLAAGLWLGAIGLATRGDVLGRVASSVPTIDRVDITITPPQYTGRRPTVERNPERIRALAGSRVEFRVRSNSASVAANVLEVQRTVAIDRGEGSFTVAATADGFVTFDPGVGGETRTIGISIDADAPPTVRITAPGKDLFVADGKRTLDVGIEAVDDIGLASLILRYTKVSGSGERFTFKDADIPVTIAKRSATDWTAQQRWAIESLALEPGDMLVYRAITTDNRPGSPPVESDAFIVEVVAPGGVAEAGYSVDPEEERTAISQQMVVLKTQRLLALKPSTAADVYLESSQEIAAEQRRVRAEFVFLMGGEMSDAGANDTSMTDIDETADAAAEEDLMAGRQLNQGRMALLRAIRAMSFAARSLNEADLSTALTHEREAVKQLELAFSKNRILLRAFAEREALDTTRRLSGDLSDLARSRRAALAPDRSERAIALQRVMEQVRRGDLARAGEEARRIDPGSRVTQSIVAELGTAANARIRGNAAAARAAVDRAMVILNTELGNGLPVQRADLFGSDLRLLRGALNDARRGRAP